ncbi:MAG: PA14 domain-containing protein [Verrucomicrobiales bacterium]
MKDRLALSMLAASVSAVVAADEVIRIEVRTLPGLMKYDQPVLRVKPGHAVEIVLRNDDQLPHNLVVLRESGVFMEVAQKAWELGPQGPPAQWIPDDARILAHSGMVDPGQTGKLSFNAPAEEGTFDFVCTFPGHAMIMNGTLVVSAAPPPGLRELTCMVFKGQWDRLPDFLNLPQESKVAVDEVADNLISVDATDLRDQFGLVFNGLLDVPTDGQYTFFLGSDDGSRLLIDDEEVIRNDGVHAYAEERKRVRLGAGVRRVRVEYFEHAGEESLTLAWGGPGFNRAWLSKQKQAAGEELPEMVLTPADGRPVIYRGFLSPNAGSRRLIAVGTQEQVHYAFDQDQLRLALMWKGAFLDVGRHWTGRGAGDIGPLGFGVIERPGGEDLAVLGAGDAWPAPDENGRARQGRFLGYRLDAAGVPTFRYAMHGVTVDDSLRATGRLAEATDALIRTISIRGAGPVEEFYFRLGTGEGPAPGPDGVWKMAGDLSVSVEGGAPPVSRGGVVLVPVKLEDNQARLVVTYRWF